MARTSWSEASSARGLVESSCAQRTARSGVGWHAGASGDTRMAQRAMASEALQALPKESSTAAPHGRDVAIAMFSPPLRNRRGGSQETPAPARPQSRLRRSCRGVIVPYGQGFSTLHLQHVRVGAARPSASALGGARLFDMMVVLPHERGLCGMLLCGCSSEENGGRRSWKLISLWCEDAFLVFSTFHASRQAPLHPWSSTSQTNE